MDAVIAPHPHISTNDGTHRITVKWKAPDDVNEFESDKQRLNEALLTLMQTMFKDTDGVFYRWESDDLVETKAASCLTETIARDYVSPKVTFIKSQSLMIFGIRFGFISSPNKWQQSPETKVVLKEQHINVSVSNSKSTSGDLVTAGYILLKAPNTTHKHYYTQYLRSRLPEVTPYFDIVRYKKTPMDQLIPHLVVKCGEKHVTPVCKSLLSILTGIGSALFLPRYALSTLPADQAKRHFEVHQTWSRSLSGITIAPHISHLDQLRNEYYDDGRIIQRSTRDWILSLKNADGSSAHCDAINGGSERKAWLLCPHNFLTQAQEEWRCYRSRLYPPSHREARYYESVAGLPDLRNIRIEIATNVSLLEKLSAADVWKQAPNSVREPTGSRDRSGKKGKSTKPRSKSQNHGTKSDDTVTSQSDMSSNASTTMCGDTTQDASDSRSTATTAASTNAPIPNKTSRFQELERMIKDAQTRSDNDGKASAAQLSGLESKFSDMDTKLTTLHATQQKLASEMTTMQSQNATQFTELRNNMISSMEATTHMSQSMVDIRSQFSQMSAFMIDLAKKMEAILNRCEGIPPEVNVNSQHGIHQTGSDFSSVAGDPSQAALSELSKTVSQLSSNGKRSLAATHTGPGLPATESKQLPLKSPIKKKHRARGSETCQTFESSDNEEIHNEVNESRLPTINLDSRFQQEEDHVMEDQPEQPVTDQIEGAIAGTNNTPENAENQLTTPNSQPVSAPPPTHQYNEANDSAGAAQT